MKARSDTLPAGRWAASVAFVRRRLSPKGYLGLHLTLGMIVLVIAGWIFGEITEDVVTKDPSLAFDQTVATYFHDRATPAMTRVMQGLSFIGSGPFLTAASLLVAALLALRRSWARLFMLLLVVPGGALLNVAIKQVIHRERPIFDRPIATLESFSFPSGHTMGSALFYGLMAYFLFLGPARKRIKMAGLVAAAVVVALVGLSRIYLGLHFLSDVLGAMAAGAGWLALCVTGVDTYLRRRQHRRVP